MINLEVEIQVRQELVDGGEYIDRYKRSIVKDKTPVAVLNTL